MRSKLLYTVLNGTKNQLTCLRIFLKHAEDVFSSPLTRSPAKLAATKFRLHLLYRDLADEVNSDLARSSAQQIYEEITGAPPPADSSEEVARNYESLNKTD